MRRSMRDVFLLVLVAILLQACTLPATGTPTPTGPAPLTLYVSRTGNDTRDCLSLTTACLTLYEAWSKSTPGSTIHIGAGTFSWTGSPVAPRNSLTLQGAGVAQTTLSYPDGDVLQFAYPATVEIHDLTISGTNPSTGGGNGIEIRAGVVLNLSNCHIHGKYWGLRLLTGATATVSNCTFDGNSYGVENFGSLTMSASTFSTNMVALDNQGVAQVQTTVFDRNGDFDPASRAGAPTITNSQGGQLTLTGGSISNAGSFGLVVESGRALLDGVNVHNNAGVAVWDTQGNTEIRSSVIQDNGSYGIDVGGFTGASSVPIVNVHETAILRNGFAGIRIDGGTVLMQNDTVSSNQAHGSDDGDGIWMEGGGTLFMLDSTVAFNTGHGIYATPGTGVTGTIIVRRSVVALNSAPCYIDIRIHPSYDFPAFLCVDTFTPATLGLGPLTPAAGTVVHPLLAGSPLIDAGTTIGCPAIDQRGFARPSGPACDIGAYEFGAGAHLTFATAVMDTPTLPVLQILTETPSPTSATLVVPQLTFIENANCRKGPGTAYNVTTSFEKGKVVDAAGRNDTSSWWLVMIPGGGTCWVSDSTVSKSGPVEQLAIVSAPPLPDTPAKLVNTDVCDVKLKKQTVDLNWATVAGATGYTLYRDGSLLMTFGAGTTAYADNPSLGAAHSYAVEALNGFGRSGQVTTSVPACK